VATTVMGIVVVTEITGEFVDAEEVSGHNPNADDEHVWAGWRRPTCKFRGNPPPDSEMMSPPNSEN